jgi:hypothetical protein
MRGQEGFGIEGAVDTNYLLIIPGLDRFLLGVMISRSRKE